MIARRIIAVVVGLALLAACLGQGCPPVGPQQAQQGIPEGFYEGEIECSTIITTYTIDMSNPEVGTPTTGPPSPAIRSFGSDGNLLTAQGSSLGPGDGSDLDLGLFTGSTTVGSVGISPGRLVVYYDYVVYMDMPDGSSVRFAGSMQDTYDLVSPGTVLLTRSTHLISDWVDDEFAEARTDCTATLER